MSMDLTGFAGKAMSNVMGIFDNKAGSSVGPSIMEKGVTALAVGAGAGLLDMAMGGNNAGKWAAGAAIACFVADEVTGGAVTKGAKSLVSGVASKIGMGASAKATP